MQALKMTSKRQVTFPVKVCEDLKIRIGDSIMIDKREIDGSPAWILMHSKQEDKSWFGAFKEYAKGKSDELSDIRDSIGQKRVYKS